MQLYFSYILRRYRFGGMLMTSICARQTHICAVRYGSICCSENISGVVTRFLQPCALRNIQLLGGKTFSCQESCTIPRYLSV